MKTDTAIRQYRSNVEGERVRMGIAEGAEAHIVGILTEMYSDPELACIREYSTNARDSHIEAGQARPIEVTLPTRYLPVLTIRDYGIGLDADGIKELYSQYGASTKRDTNSAQGMLGIGCKSALAYTDQFTVMGFKGGIKTTVLISRDEDGAATQTIVSVEGTSEPNGVEVSIPVKADNNMREKAELFFRFWPEGSVTLIHGGDVYEPRKIGADNDDKGQEGQLRTNIWLDDRTLLTNEVDNDLVVMGYVAYPLVDGDDPLFDAPRTGLRYNRSDYSAVCFVDIGDVNFAPSRESLMTTRRTKDKLAELRAHVAATFDASIRKQIAEAKTAKEAQERLIAGKALGFNDTPKAQWQGRDVVLALSRTKKQKDGTRVPTLNPAELAVDECLKYSYLTVNATSYTRKQGERVTAIQLEDRYNSSPWTIFTGFDGKWLTDVKRAKLDQWRARKGFSSVGKSLFVDKLTPDEKFWTDGWAIYDWAEVDAEVLPRAATPDGGTKQVKGSYPGFVDGEQKSEIAAHTIDTTKPIYYHHGNRWSAGHHRAIKSGAVDIRDATVIALSQNRMDKFKRDFPMAKSINEAAKEAAQKWADNIDPDQAKAWAVSQQRAHNTLKALKGEDFDDPSLNTLIRLANTPCDSYHAGLTKYGAWIDVAQQDAVRTLCENTAKKYPLAPWSGYGTPSGKELAHIVLYLKAAIAAERGN